MDPQWNYELTAAPIGALVVALCRSVLNDNECVLLARRVSGHYFVLDGISPNSVVVGNVVGFSPIPAFNTRDDECETYP